MKADGDTDGVTFRYARGKLILYALGSFAFAALAAWIIYRGLAPQGSFKEAAMWLGAPLFGLGGLVCLLRVFDRSAIVFISPAGIRDSRISEDIIPWHAILGMTARSYRRQNFITLAIDPEAEKGIKLSRLARWSGPMNAKLGFSGLVLNPAGLDGSFDDIVQALVRFQPEQG
jgi:hypothetical protein